MKLARPTPKDHTWLAQAEFSDGARGAEYFLSEDDALHAVRRWLADPTAYVQHARVLQVRWVLR